jgi:hypothetical protein
LSLSLTPSHLPRKSAQNCVSLRSSPDSDHVLGTPARRLVVATRALLPRLARRPRNRSRKRQEHLSLSTSPPPSSRKYYIARSGTHGYGLTSVQDKGFAAGEFRSLRLDAGKPKRCCPTHADLALCARGCHMSAVIRRHVLLALEGFSAEPESPNRSSSDGGLRRARSDPAPTDRRPG